ncbi:hypothetical protein C8R43DRAFT_463316 [Mycena crocata]|nr:hypothetical protein C8R43DRAFT_463316 [Mycena crocata]
MIETMNVTHRSPVKSARNRAHSTSSTSGSSVPRTPIDDYEEFHRDGRLGTEFSVLKMDSSSIPRKKRSKKITGVFPWDQDSSSSDTTEQRPPPVPLPAWLASTFSSLTTQHPLRLLLPQRIDSEPTPSPPAQPVQDMEDDSPFSFSAPADPINVSPPRDMFVDAGNDANPSTQSTQTPLHSQATEPTFVYRPASLPDPSFGAIQPFSTPGPTSVMSRSILSAGSIPTVHISEPTPSSVSMSQIHFAEPSYTDCALSFSPPLHSTPAPRYTASQTQVITPLYEEHTDNGPTWDHSESHSVTMNVFSTPGPGYRAPQPVYFDSPTEDPSDSDPLQPGPGYELESLDFRWEPFIQKSAREEVIAIDPDPPAPAVISNSDDYYYEIRVEPEGEDDEEGQLYASINMEPVSMNRDVSPGPFSFAPPVDPPTEKQRQQTPADDDMPTEEQSQQAPITPERQRPRFFAPVPGIFVSPLRNDERASSPTAVEVGLLTFVGFNGSILLIQGDNEPGSQTSHDSIEDWDDTTD